MPWMQRRRRVRRKHLALAITGGLLYILIETIWRGYSHWTMFVLGGICFLALGMINEVLPWEMPLWQQMLCQPMAGVACLGLQRDAWKHPGPDMSAVFSSVAAGEPGGHPFG